MLRSFKLSPVLLLLSAYAVFMVSTNHRLTMLDDEGTIVATANVPTAERLQTFIRGTGQHLHPPLTDILLHGWLTLTHHSFALLRVPAILLYIAGLLLTAKCGQLLGNRRTYWAVLLFGTLWPFGYFYARITGWYCFSFLLIAAVTYCYFLLLEKTSVRRWILFALIAILLVWSNYFGLIVFLLLLADLLLYRRAFASAHVRDLLVTTGVILLSFLPLLHDLLAGTRNADSIAATTWAAAVVKVCYMLFAMLASVAVAPWFLLWSLPAIAASLILYILLLSHQMSRRFAIYFVLLILSLSATHTLDLKRLLFVSPWLLLSVALCISTGARWQARTATSALVVVFLIGWLAIADGKHRAASNFYEPWQSVAISTADQARGRSAIVSDSMSYFFYLNYQLGVDDVAFNGSYAGADTYQQHGFNVYRSSLPVNVQPSRFSRITTVRGIGVPTDMARMAGTMQQLEQTCRHVGSQRSTPDPSAVYKREINPKAPSVAYRVMIDHFDCDNSR